MNTSYFFIIPLLCLSSFTKTMQHLCGELWAYEDPSHVVAVLLAAVPQTSNPPLFGFTRMISHPSTDTLLFARRHDPRGTISIYLRPVNALEKPQNTPCYWVEAASLFNVWRAADALALFSGMGIHTREEPEHTITLSDKFLRTIGMIQLPDTDGFNYQTDQGFVLPLHALAKRGYDEMGRRTHYDNGDPITY